MHTSLELRKLELPANLTSFRFSGKGFEAILGFDNTVKGAPARAGAQLWDLDRGILLKQLHEQSSPLSLRHIATSADRTAMVTGVSKDGRHWVQTWALPQAVPLRRLEGHEKSISAVAISPDGRWTASASAEEKRLIVWNTESGESVSQRRLPNGTINWLGFTPDCARVVIALQDRIESWDLSSGQVSAIVARNPRSVGFGDDGIAFVTSDWDGLWSIDWRQTRRLGTRIRARAYVSEQVWWREGKMLLMSTDASLAHVSMFSLDQTWRYRHSPNDDIVEVSDLSTLAASSRPSISAAWSSRLSRLVASNPTTDLLPTAAVERARLAYRNGQLKHAADLFAVAAASDSEKVIGKRYLELCRDASKAKVTGGSDPQLAVLRSRAQSLFNFSRMLDSKTQRDRKIRSLRALRETAQLLTDRDPEHYAGPMYTNLATSDLASLHEEGEPIEKLQALVEEALDAGKAAVRLDPNSDQLKKNLAYTYADVGEIAARNEHWGDALDARMESATIWRSLIDNKDTRFPQHGWFDNWANAVIFKSMVQVELNRDWLNELRSAIDFMDEAVVAAPLSVERRRAQVRLCLQLASLLSRTEDDLTYNAAYEAWDNVNAALEVIPNDKELERLKELIPQRLEFIPE